MGSKPLDLNKYCTTLFAAALIWLAAGCASQIASEEGSSEYIGDLISVNPPGPVTVGFSDTVKFDVTLANEVGIPVSGASLDVTFIEQPHNAQVIPDRLVTDAQGKGSVVFTAPMPTENESVDFKIRFRSAEAETYVGVKVDPGLVKVSFQVDYSGKRVLSQLAAELYRIDENTGERFAVNKDEKDADLPATFEFTGLLRDGKYEAEVSGFHNNDTVRATGTLQDLVPNSDQLTLSLQDTFLNITGNFAARWEITPDGALDWAVDRLVEAPAFVQNTASAVMDGIETVLLNEDPFAGETFIAERAEKNLDAYLDTHLQESGVDLQADFETVGQTAKRAAERIWAEGTMEIGKTEDSLFVGYHTIDRLTFGIDNDTIGPDVNVEMLDRASCEITYGANDTLNIGAHDLPIGLGTPIEKVFTYACAEILGDDDIADAIKSIVDCAEIATFLETSLSDVTVRSSIELGCLSAIDTAKADVHAAVTAISETNRLSFSDGVCMLAVPAADNQVTELSGEIFTLHWHAVGADAAPMTAVFTAIIP